MARGYRKIAEAALYHILSVKNEQLHKILILTYTAEHKQYFHLHLLSDCSISKNSDIDGSIY